VTSRPSPLALAAAAPPLPPAKPRLVIVVEFESDRPDVWIRADDPLEERRMLLYLTGGAPILERIAAALAELEKDA
jgi:hypothetical protein